MKKTTAARSKTQKIICIVAIFGEHETNKTESVSARKKDVTMETPRPTIVISGPEFEYNKGIAARRRKQTKLAMPKLTRQISDRIWYVLHKYRMRQRNMMEDSDIEDPNPYDPTYVFYCFKGSHDE